ncbi:MAG: hypothetical protein HFH82_15235 [Lachnospiraceae bacterium]|nr:hypothetical protein [Lachnospiraceae bacterium]
MKILNEIMLQLSEKLYRAVQARNVSEVNCETNRIRSQVLSCYTLSNEHELAEMLDRYQRWLKGVTSTFETEEEKIAYQMGLLGGTIGTICELQEQKEQFKAYEMAPLDTKYQDAIIGQLMEKEYVQHNQLAKNLGISSSQLTTIMSKVEERPQNIVTVSHVGKFKYYCLTDMGRRYYGNLHRGNFREEICELLNHVLERCKFKKVNNIKSFVDKYYGDDIELKQKAMEVEYFIDSLEVKSRKMSKQLTEIGMIPFLISGPGTFSTKRLVGRQFDDNNEETKFAAFMGNEGEVRVRVECNNRNSKLQAAWGVSEESGLELMVKEREEMYG